MPDYLTTLTKAQNELAHRVQDHIVELDLSTSEFLVMWAAVQDERATAAAIRQRLGMRQSTFTSLVARLVRRGYVRTRRSKRDLRTRYLVPTFPGLQAVRIARSIHRELEAQAQPHDSAGVYRGLVRLSVLIDHLPEPELTDDGLPSVTG